MTTHETFSREENIKGSSDRSFGLVFAAVFGLIGLWPFFFGRGLLVWAVAVSLAFTVLAFVRPGLLAPLNRWWMKFGLLLSRIVNPVVMGLMFYLVITPMGVCMRLMGKDLLRLKFDRKAGSYWIPREPPGPEPESLSNQF